MRTLRKKFILLLREVREGSPGKMVVELSFTGGVGDCPWGKEGEGQTRGDHGMQDVSIVNLSCAASVIDFYNLEGYPLEQTENNSLIIFEEKVKHV